MVKVCSDYDEDCKDITDPFMCWLGSPPTEIESGEVIECPIADGICPFCKSMKKDLSRLHRFDI